MLVPPCVIDASQFDLALPELPNAEGVFVIWAGGEPAYLAKTGMLRRRLLRVLKAPSGDGPSRGLNLRSLATKVDYWLTGSRFESGLIHYELARAQHPDTYLKVLKLRMPAYVRLILSNRFPRSHVTSRIGVSDSVHFGPFRSRAAAELFESELLDQFQMRRCQEDLAPRPDHPGCIYGEMNMCLRPCQQAVGEPEYRDEAERVADFLRHNGRNLLQSVESARDLFSEEMDFEAAARQHKRLDRIGQMLTQAGGLACDIDRLFGVAITPAASAGAVKLWFVCKGSWQEPVEFPLIAGESLDRRLRESVASLAPVHAPRQDRQEHLALLARWHYSTWRDGGWVQFESLTHLPYRKVVRAISALAKVRASAAE